MVWTLGWLKERNDIMALKKTGKYAYGLNDENFESGRYDTIEEAFEMAIADAKIENEDLYEEDRIETVYAGEILDFIPMVDPDYVIERILDMLNDEMYDVNVFEYLDRISKEDMAKLGTMLTDTFNKWAEETNNKMDYSVIEKVEERKVL